MPVAPAMARRRLAALVAVLSGAIAVVGVVPIASATSSTHIATNAAATAARAAVDPNQAPTGYYGPAVGLSGSALHVALHDIIDGHTKLTYAALWDALPVTDPDPAVPGNVITFYSRLSKAASNHGGSNGQWNREHSWAKSHGDFGETTGPGTDLFHMRPEDVQTNSSRGNKDFDNGGTAPVPNCTGCRADGDSFEPPAIIRGDLARGLFYMAIRYDGYSGDQGYDLEMANSVNTSSNSCSSFTGTGALGCHGKLSTLLAWAIADVPDATERTRNQVIYSQFQHNRNPFIDNPELVEYLWGSKVGQPWPGPATTSPTDPPTTDLPTDPPTTDLPTDPTDPPTTDLPTDPTDPPTTDLPTDPPTTDLPTDPTDPPTTDLPTDPPTTDLPTDPTDPPTTDLPTDPTDPPTTDLPTDPTDPPTTDLPTDPTDPPTTDLPTDPTTSAPACDSEVVTKHSRTRMTVEKPGKLKSGRSAIVRIRVTPDAATTGRNSRVTLLISNGGSVWTQTKRLVKGRAVIKVGPLWQGKLKLTAIFADRIPPVTEECPTAETGWFGSRASRTLVVHRR